MPLPLIPVVIGGAAALIGGKGVHSGAKGIQKIRRAKKSLAKAQRRYDTTFNQVEHDRRNVNRAAEQYGALKLHLQQTTLSRFIQLVDRLNQRGGVAALQSLRLTEIDAESIDVLRAEVIEAERIGLGCVGAAGPGAAAGGSACAAVGLSGTASTGAAISGLSGAAATNATLAWLGGGSLASGGLGMVGGTIVLAGIMAGPALLVGGWALAIVGERAELTAALKVSEAARATADLRTLSTKLAGVRTRLAEFTTLVKEIDHRAAAALDGVLALDIDLADDHYIPQFELAAALVHALARGLLAAVLTKDGDLSTDSARVVTELALLAEG